MLCSFVIKHNKAPYTLISNRYEHQVSCTVLAKCHIVCIEGPTGPNQPLTQPQSHKEDGVEYQLPLTTQLEASSSPR